MTLDGLDEPVRRYLAHALPGDPGPATGVRLAMSGRIKVGAWMPFTASQRSDGRSFTWRARVAVGSLTLLTVLDRFADGAGSVEGRLFGRRRLFGADDENTTRSAAGRAALEGVFAPMCLLPERGVTWRTEGEDLIVASWDVPPERPEVRLRIDGNGALRSASALRWGKLGRSAVGYVPCGCEVWAERRFGDLVVPSRVTVGWWFGTPRYKPFFEAEITELAPVVGAA
jgi:hypothetical protein